VDLSALGHRILDSAALLAILFTVVPAAWLLAGGD